MVESDRAKEVLKAIEQEDSIQTATLVSRSGMYIAGDVPRGAHTETFVAMAAILLGSAETAATELNEKMDYISVELEKSVLIVKGATEKTLLVVCAEGNKELKDLLGIIDRHIKELTDDQ